MRGRADTFSKKSRRTVPRSNLAFRACVLIRSRFVKCRPWFSELTFPRLLKGLTFKPLLAVKVLTDPVDELQNRRRGVAGHTSYEKIFPFAASLRGRSAPDLQDAPCRLGSPSHGLFTARCAKYSKTRGFDAREHCPANRIYESAFGSIHASATRHRLFVRRFSGRHTHR
jgi:hypothetical protein